MIKNKHLVELSFDLPGFSREDIKIDVKESSIFIKADKKEENKIGKGNYKSSEKIAGNFSYFSDLPLVEKDKADILFVDGKLNITIPKKR